MKAYTVPATNVPQNYRRKIRRPEHTFQVRHKPFAITPFCIAPVLPGETLKSILWQSRAVTDPIKSPLVGWWLEYYWFYVKHRDLAERDTLTAMMLTPGADVTGIDDTSTSTDWYHPGTVNNINWTKLCTIRVVEEYFRNDGEAWNTYLIGNYPAAQINGNSWLDSMKTKTSVEAYDVSVVDGSDADSTLEASEVDAAMRQWELLRQNNMTQQSYEEFLMTYGVRPQATELHRPELIRYARSWQYPSNTVEPTTGTPSSAVSWGIAERADKDRYFKEPGFILGLTVARPKVYLKNQVGSAAAVLNDVFAWLPATLRNDFRASQKLIANTNALLASQTDSFWIDVADLYVYGDQFINFALTETDASLVAMPTAAAQKRYPTSTDADALFANASPKIYVRQDGVAHFAIAGTTVDQTPTVNL